MCVRELVCVCGTVGDSDTSFSRLYSLFFFLFRFSIYFFLVLSFHILRFVLLRPLYIFFRSILRFVFHFLYYFVFLCFLRFVFLCFITLSSSASFVPVRSEAVSGRDSLGRPSIEQLSLNSAFLDLSTVRGSVLTPSPIPHQPLPITRFPSPISHTLLPIPRYLYPSHHPSPH